MQRHGDAMLDFMVSNPDLGRGNLEGPVADKLWADLTKCLNKLGPKKTAGAWRAAWSSRVSAAVYRAKRAAEGAIDARNRPYFVSPRDRKMLSVMGFPMPEEIKAGANSSQQDTLMRAAHIKKVSSKHSKISVRTIRPTDISSEASNMHVVADDTPTVTSAVKERELLAEMVRRFEEQAAGALAEVQRQHSALLCFEEQLQKSREAVHSSMSLLQRCQERARAHASPLSKDMKTTAPDAECAASGTRRRRQPLSAMAASIDLARPRLTRGTRVRLGYTLIKKEVDEL